MSVDYFQLKDYTARQSIRSVAGEELDNQMSLIDSSLAKSLEVYYASGVFTIKGSDINRLESDGADSTQVSYKRAIPPISTNIVTVAESTLNILTGAKTGDVATITAPSMTASYYVKFGLELRSDGKIYAVWGDQDAVESGSTSPAFSRKGAIPILWCQLQDDGTGGQWNFIEIAKSDVNVFENFGGGSGGGGIDTYSTIVDAQARDNNLNNDLIFVVETNTFYKYAPSSHSVKYVDNKFYLSEDTNSNARWIAISGKYQAYITMPVPFKLYATETNDWLALKLIIGASKVYTEDGAYIEMPPSQGVVGPFIDQNLIDFTTGAVSNSSTLKLDGGSFSLPTSTIGYFRRLLFKWDAVNGYVNSTFSSEQSSQASLTDAGILAKEIDGQPIGFVDLVAVTATTYKSATATTNNIINADIVRFGNGAGDYGDGSLLLYSLRIDTSFFGDLKSGYHYMVNMGSALAHKTLDLPAGGRGKVVKVSVYNIENNGNGYYVVLDPDSTEQIRYGGVSYDTMTLGDISQEVTLAWDTTGGYWVGMDGAENFNGTFNGSLNVTGDLSVGTTTLVVDSVNNRVGINKTPAASLDVQADTNDGIAVTPSESSTYLNATYLTDLTGAGTFLALKNPINGDITSTGIGSFRNSGGINLALIARGIAFVANGAEKARITSSGFGIGTKTPGSTLDVVNGAGSATIGITSGDTNSTSLRFGSTSDSIQAAISYNASTQKLSFSGYNNSTRMTIDNAGLIGIGTESPISQLNMTAASGTAILTLSRSNSISTGALGSVGATNASSNYVSGITLGADGATTRGKIEFRTTTSPNASLYSVPVQMTIDAGGIVYSLPTYNNTIGSAANVYISSGGELFRFSSSLKYKKNIEPYTKGLNEVNQLRPVFYESKKETETQRYAGFIAEEIQELGLTEFVQYDGEGNPDGISYANMISLLTKAIQELTQRVTDLENR